MCLRRMYSVGGSAAAVALLILGSQLPASGRGAGWPDTVVALTPDDLRVWDGRIDLMMRSGGLRLRRQEEDPVVPGRRHQRVNQYYRGVRVAGGDVTRQFRGEETVSIFGRLHDGIDIDSTPDLSPDDAKTIIERSGNARPGSVRIPELTILPTDDGRFVLTYAARVVSASGLTRYFIDAHTGEVVLSYSDLKTQSAVGTGFGVLGDTKKVSTRSTGGMFVADDLLRPPTLKTFDMRGDVNLAVDLLDGLYEPTVNDLASSPNNRWQDGAAVDAHTYQGWTYDYLYKRFGWHGLDNRNARIYGLVHPVRRADLFSYSAEITGIFFLNAFYCDTCGPDSNGVIVFGEGLPPGVILTNGQTVDFFSGALDIVAHELTHGVTGYTSNLIYRNESGALNEAFSDVIGAGAEFFFQERGDGLLKADYLIGEDVLRPGGARSIADPQSSLWGPFPDHYSRRYLGAEDNGGVHSNSTIVTHAFYLAVEGGTNRTSGLPVQGVGAASREQIEKVFFRAFAFMLPSDATFSVARAATVQAARDLYGTGSAAERAVTQAWTAVGVN